MCTRFFSRLNFPTCNEIRDHLYSYFWSKKGQLCFQDTLIGPEHEMLTEKRTFTWRLDPYTMCEKKLKTRRTEKMELVGGATIGLKAEWELIVKLYPQNPDEDEQQLLKIQLKCTKTPTDCDVLYANYDIRIGNNDTFDILNYKMPVINYMKGGDKKASFCRSGDWFWTYEYRVMLEVEVTFYAPALSTSQILEKFKPKFLAKLQEDLTKAMSTPMGHFETPTKIVVPKAKKEFLVSRGVISARSPVFERMFGTELEEAKTGIVRVTDISFKTMKVLLQFLCTGTLRSEWSNDDVIVHLVYAAGKYQLPDLLEFLDHSVGGVCTTETAGRLLNLARKLELKKAEREVFEFMQKRIRNFDEFADFYYESTAVEIL